MRINTNIASLNAQANNAQTNNKLSSSLEKLSSGLQINKASDDASGMAIADKLRTQASSLGQGISNANSASALIQIADKAMSEQSNILDIVKTKLIQASTSTTSAEGREAVRKDVSKLLEQLDNISGQTNYNGVNLLDKKDAEFSFQVGEDASFDIGLSTAYAVNTAGLGSAQKTISDEDTTLNYGVGVGVAIANDDTTMALQFDPNEATTIAGAKKAVNIGGSDYNGTTGTATIKIEAENVSALVFDNNGSTLDGMVTLTTSDVGLMGAFDANGDITKVSDGVYTIDSSTVAIAVEFGSNVDISDLTVTGMYLDDTAAASDQIGVVTNEEVNVTKLGGSAEVSFASGSFVASATAIVASTKDVVGPASNTAEGLKFETAGLTLEEGTASVKYDDSAAGLAQYISGGVQITNETVSGGVAEDASFTLNADGVERLHMATATAKVVLSSNDSATMKKLDELAEGNALLTKIDSGAYTFEGVTGQANSFIDFGGKFDVKDLTISGVAVAEVISVQTEEAVHITTGGDESSDSALIVSAGNFNSNTNTVAAAGGLTGVSSEGLSYTESLAGLKGLEENGLTADMANKYMSVVDNAMTQLNSVRSDFGSTQNQLDVATRNMMTTQVNIKAAESVIRDVDYAAESANFNKQNIIAQAGTYAMSQANSMQQNVMRLLQ